MNVHSYAEPVRPHNLISGKGLRRDEAAVGQVEIEEEPIICEKCEDGEQRRRLGRRRSLEDLGYSQRLRSTRTTSCMLSSEIGADSGWKGKESAGIMKRAKRKKL